MPRIVRLENLSQFTAVQLLSDPGYDPVNRTIPNCVQVTLVWLLTDGRRGNNVLHARYAGGFVPTTTIANSIHSTLTSGAAWTTLSGFLSPTGTFSGVILRDLNAPDMPEVPSNTPGVAGTSSGVALPDEVAAVLTLRTAKVGRRFRGRMYLPNWASNALGAGNVIAGPAVTAYQAWADGPLHSGMNSNGLQWALGLHARVAYTGTSGNQIAARNAETELITVQTVRDNHWDTQRRRGLK